MNQRPGVTTRAMHVTGIEAHPIELRLLAAKNVTSKHWTYKKAAEKTWLCAGDNRKVGEAVKK